jgi:hypothetical protein
MPFIARLTKIHKLLPEVRLELMRLLIKEIKIDYDSQNEKHLIAISFNLPESVDEKVLLFDQKTVCFSSEFCYI